MDLRRARDINGLHDRPLPNVADISLANAIAACAQVRETEPEPDEQGRRTLACFLEAAEVPRVLAAAIAAHGQAAAVTNTVDYHDHQGDISC